MSANASDILIDTLIEWGVDRIFGLPGDGINGVMEAIRTRQDRIRFVQVRHVENVASLACRIAITGRGVTHLSIPTDVQEEPLGKTTRSSRNVSHHVSSALSDVLRI